MQYAPVSVVLARLRRARSSQGLSQAELARRSGVPQSQISKLESSRAKDPAMSTIIALAVALNIPPVSLLISSEDRYRLSLDNAAPSSARAILPVSGITAQNGQGLLHAVDGSLTVVLRIGAVQQNSVDAQAHAQTLSQLVNSTPWPVRLVSRPRAGVAGFDHLICLSAPEGQEVALLSLASSWQNKLAVLNVYARPITAEELSQLVAESLRLHPSAAFNDSVTPIDAPPGSAASNALLAEFATTLTPTGDSADHGLIKVNDELFFRTLIMHQMMPAEVTPRWFAPMYSLGKGTVSWDITPLDSHSAQRHNKTKLAALHSQTPSRAIALSIQELENFIADIDSGRTKPFMLSGQISLSAETVAQLQSDVAHVYMAVSELSLNEASYRHNEGYFASLPVSPSAAPCPGQTRTVHTQLLATLSPWTV